jgi:hypothetical protein
MSYTQHMESGHRLAYRPGYFDRFDICAAYNLLAQDFGLYDIKARLDSMDLWASHLQSVAFIHARPAQYYHALSENGRAIYDSHVAADGMSVLGIRSTFA